MCLSSRRSTIAHWEQTPDSVNKTAVIVRRPVVSLFVPPYFRRLGLSERFSFVELSSITFFLLQAIDDLIDNPFNNRPLGRSEPLEDIFFRRDIQITIMPDADAQASEVLRS